MIRVNIASADGQTCRTIVAQPGDRLLEIAQNDG